MFATSSPLAEPTIGMNRSGNPLPRSAFRAHGDISGAVVNAVNLLDLNCTDLRMYGTVFAQGALMSLQQWQSAKTNLHTVAPRRPRREAERLMDFVQSYLGGTSEIPIIEQVLMRGAVARAPRAASLKQTWAGHRRGPTNPGDDFGLGR